MTEQLHQADKNYSRPIMIDVAGDERFYSQYVPMLGMSRHVNNTTLSYKDYRDLVNHPQAFGTPRFFCLDVDSNRTRHQTSSTSLLNQVENKLLLNQNKSVFRFTLHFQQVVEGWDIGKHSPSMAKQLAPPNESWQSINLIKRSALLKIG